MESDDFTKHYIIFLGFKLSFDSLNIASSTHMIGDYMPAHALVWIFNADGMMQQSTTNVKHGKRESPEMEDKK